MSNSLIAKLVTMLCFVAFVMSLTINQIGAGVIVAALMVQNAKNI